MKVVQRFLMLLAFFSAISVGISNYIKGESFTWQFIALVWILNSYVALVYIEAKEEKERSK